jgi:aryl-alcohol dehydrogenase-like predicted oxidoreductase
MNSRPFGNTGVAVSEVGLGTWQLGGDCWGDVSDAQAEAVLRRAVDSGITFIDTADVYGAGRSEQRIGRLPAGRKETVFVATKVGRAGLYPDKYGYDDLRRCTEASLERLGTGCLDLTQLHCIPPAVLARGEVFDHLRRLRDEGLIRHFGASVESLDEALLCLKQGDLAALQIIFNIFRQKPIDALFAQAEARGVAIIVRLPLASGLLAGKFTRQTTFPENDHRRFNADGQAFNVGETFAGLGLAKGAELAGKLKPFVPDGMSMAQMAVRWVLDHEAVSVVIPGASRSEHVAANAAASDLPPLSDELHRRLREFYERERIEAHIRGPY